MREYARFSDAPIGPALIAGDAGLTLTTTSDALSLSRTARGTVSHSGGSHGVEFVFWGDGPLAAAIGLLQASASLSSALGAGAGSIGWRLATGEIYLDGVEVDDGLPIPVKGEVVAVHFYEAPGFNFRADFYHGSVLVSTIDLPPAATWYFGVSMASTLAGDLTCAVNAGQWPVLTAAGQAAWQPPAPSVLTVRLSDWHWMTAPDDDAENERFEGVLDSAGMDTLSAVGFWPWADSVAPRAGSAQFTVRDRVDLLAPIEGAADVRVSVKQADYDGTYGDAAAVARFVLDAIEVVDDGTRLVRLRDAHDALDEPINRGVFLPYVTALAWQQQPVVIGAVASVPLLAANSDGTVGFLADAPLAHVDVVLDRGDALETGTWSIAPGNQQLLLESPPLGPVLADVSSIGAAMTPAPLEDALHQVYSRVGHGAWSSTDAAEIDADTGYAGIGFYVGGGAMSARDARDTILANYGASCYQAPDGVLRIARLIDPDSATATAELSPARLVDDLTWLPDTAPSLSRRMGYRPNAARMDASDFVTDLVDVPIARRAELMRPYRGLVYSAVPLAARYAAAERRNPFLSMFWRQEDAQAEIDRICSLYAVERRFYLWRNAGDVALQLHPGQVVHLTYPLHGLDAGRNMLVVSVQGNRSTGRFTIKLWGA